MIRRLKRRIKRDLFKFKLINNSKIFIYKSNYGFRVLLNLSKIVDNRFYLDSFENENFELLKKILREGMTVLDIGANIGLYTLLFCKKVGNFGKVYSFEPAPEAYSRLKQNIKINNFNNLKCFNIGISEYTGNSSFYVCEDDAYNSLGKKPMMTILKTIEIPVTTVDEFCISEKITDVDIMKIDTEGADYLVLKGAKKILTSNNAPIVFCEYNRSTEGGYDYRLDEMYDYLMQVGYGVYEIKKGLLYKFDFNFSTASDIINIKENHRNLFRFAD